jgi:8-oxo-dGTP diphosphatase
MSKYIEKAGAVVIRENNQSIEILLCHRGRGFEDWTFPKGHVEPDETVMIAAIREVKEETGLDIQISKKLPDIYYEYDAGKTKLSMFLGEVTGGKLQKNYENDKLKWFSYEDALEKITYENLKDFFQSIKNDLDIKKH